MNPLGKWVRATCPELLRDGLQRNSNPRPHGRWSSTLTTRPPRHPPKKSSDLQVSRNLPWSGRGCEKCPHTFPVVLPLPGQRLRSSRPGCIIILRASHCKITTKMPKIQDYNDQSTMLAPSWSALQSLIDIFFIFADRINTIFNALNTVCTVVYSTISRN